MGMREEADKLLPALVAFSDECIGTGSGPGPLFHALEIIAIDLEDKAEMPRLLKQARDVYASGDPYLLGHIIRIENFVNSVDPNQRMNGLREQIEATIVHAMSFAPGLMRMAFLEEAAALATKHGINDLADWAIAELQKISLDDLDLKPIRSVTSIPAEAFEALVDAQFGDSLKETLENLVRQAPPSGSREQNEEFGGRMEKEAPLSSTIARKHVGDDGLTRITATSPEDREDERLARIEVMRIGLGGGEVVARVLETLVEHFGAEATEVLDALSGLPHLSESVRSSVAKGLVYLTHGLYEEAATVTMPKAETLVRALADEKKVLRYRVQRDAADGGRSTRGQYPQLGALLADIRPWLDPSWDRFLTTFLVSPFGKNYRNDLLHGYIDEVQRVDAALTILCALRLMLIPLAEGEAETDE